MRAIFKAMTIIGCAAMAACVYEAPAPFTQPMVLGGKTIDAANLNRGLDGYSKYCAACHGRNGDGRGYSSQGLDTPPRDFRLATYKFAGVTPGDLPHDEDLARIVSTGLDGTVMMKWAIPDALLSDILQYIKTFSPEGQGWRKAKSKPGERILPGKDPWGESKRKEAIVHGKLVYHGYASCYSCHPAYATLSELNAFRATYEMPPMEQMRPNAWMPDPKESTTYSVAVAGDKACKASRDCGADNQLCRLGRCERKLQLMPPDFLLNALRSGSGTEDIYRVIAAGIPGTAMPTWKGALSEKDLWGMSYFVESLVGLRGTKNAYAMQSRLRDEAQNMVHEDPQQGGN